MALVERGRRIDIRLDKNQIIQDLENNWNFVQRAKGIYRIYFKRIQLVSNILLKDHSYCQLENVMELAKNGFWRTY